MNNSLINYKMDKWSHIEFAFIPEELRHYYIRFHDSIVDEPYLSVHLSQSVFKTGVFQPIIFMFNTNYRIINYCVSISPYMYG
jgi:hypothetical protein